MSKLQQTLVVVSVICTGFFLPSAEARKWKSSDGKYQVEAEFVEVVGTRVRLKKADGILITVPLARLSQQDRQFVAAKRPAKSANETASPEEIAAKKKIESTGLRVLSSGLVLPEETKLSKGLRDVAKLRKQMFNTNRDLARAQLNEAQNQREISALTQANLNLNTRLANVGPGEVLLNNKLVGAINGNNNRVELLRQQRTRLTEQVTGARGRANEVREAYIQHILELREMAGSVQSRSQSLSQDSQFTAALSEWNKLTGNSFQPGQSRGFKASLSRLKRVEDTVLSESIPLRSDSGTFHVSVVINGNKTQEMVVDSGASLISLPQNVAQQCGITVKPTDPTIVLQLADGRRIQGKRVTIPSVRVGKFTVEKVDCAVLGPEATNADPLLGMSFLGQFKFEVNAQEATLTMVKVDASGEK